MDIINLEKIISETTDPATYQYFQGSERAPHYF